MPWINRTSLNTAIFLSIISLSFAQKRDEKRPASEIWAEKKLNDMTVDEKIGQLFMIRAHSDKGAEHVNTIQKYIRDFHIGGLCFFQGTPEKQAQLTNKYQKLSKTPLMVAIDAEWGLGMRFPDKAISFPRQLMLGAIQNNNLIYEMGKEIARELKRIGVHVNFAPVVDINNNPQNPVINDRSFGEDRFNVISKSFAYMKGLEDGGVLPVAKHFPGHGDTDVDSHLDLPVIKHNRKRLDSIELMPFKMLIEQGIGGIMVAHLHIPEIDDRPNRPTTLSSNTIDELLINEMKFEGLVFTDAMEMKGVTKHFSEGEAEYEALLAGNDFLVLPQDLPKSYQFIKAKYENGELPEERINRSVRKILLAKYKLNLMSTPLVSSMEKIDKEINLPAGVALKTKLIERSITLVENANDFVPVQQIIDQRFISLSIGSKEKTAFQKRMDSYVPDMVHISIDKKLSEERMLRVINQCSKFDVVIISLHDMNKYAKRNFGIDPQSVTMIRQIASQVNVILSIFGSPYALKFFEGIPHIVQAYNEDHLTQDITAQAIFGAIEISGFLPVSACPKFAFGTGINAPELNRLGFCIPERVGLDSDSLYVIEKIVDEMIQKKAAPGCQILIAKNRNIVYHKAFGHHDYKKTTKSQLGDVYDLASITKILSSTIAIMKLHEEKKLNIYHPLKRYIQESDTCNKGNIIIEDILSHHAGLAGWIPFYASTLDSSGKKPFPSLEYYRKNYSDSFSIKVADELYLRTDYRDSIWARILNSDLRTKRNYRYSDIGFYLMHEVIKRISGKDLDSYVSEKFYNPLGLKNIGYNPLNRIARQRIVPSEKDSYFRNQVLQGYVHDMGAAMLGGVSGHAGLFSNSYDLAVLMQMLLNGGNYGGKKYLKAQTIHEFTDRYYRSSRRGIGFDMKENNGKRKMNMSEKASDSTFGHLGFTGTAVFADPKNEIVYIFLSNRTFPSMENNKLSRDEYRPRIQSAIYNAIMN